MIIGTNRIITLACLLLLAVLPLRAEIRDTTTVVGNASYYSDKLQGHKMANGEKYDPDSFSCAHRTIPIGTMVKVRNPSNGKECIVKVTDRGPFSKKLSIDLSKAAAKYLGIIPSGYSKVEITPLYEWAFPYLMLEPGPWEVPELKIEYEPVATYPSPAWRKYSPREKGK